MQPQQRNRRHGIARRRGRILHRLAPSRKHAQTLAIGGRFGIEEPSGNRVEKFCNHCVCDGLRELEIAEVGRRFVGVEASKRGRGVVVQQAGNFAMVSLRIRIRNHVQQLCGAGALARVRRRWLPRFRQNAVQRPQRKAACGGEIEHLRCFQVCTHAHAVPSHIDCLVDVRRGPLEPSRIHFILCGIE